MAEFVRLCGQYPVERHSDCDMARCAYDAAKSAGRMAKAKQAHDTIIVQVHSAQANALAIEARAKIRLAEEYDAAEDRGEVAKVGQPSVVAGHNDTSPLTAADLGLRRDEIHEGRLFRDACAVALGIEWPSIVCTGDDPLAFVVSQNLHRRHLNESQRAMVAGRLANIT